MSAKKYINTPKVAELTGRQSNKIIGLAKSGAIPGHKTNRGCWRYDEESVLKYFGLLSNPIVAKEPETVLSPYKLAVQIIENTSRCLLIVGKAGSGKTTFLKELNSAMKWDTDY